MPHYVFRNRLEAGDTLEVVRQKLNRELKEIERAQQIVQSGNFPLPVSKSAGSSVVQIFTALLRVVSVTASGAGTVHAPFGQAMPSATYEAVGIFFSSGGYFGIAKPQYPPYTVNDSRTMNGVDFTVDDAGTLLVLVGKT